MSSLFLSDNLHQAVADLCWLLGRGYAPTASLKLVGDRHGLNVQQRRAAQRMSCAPQAAIERTLRQVIRADALWIDGYNVLTTVQVAIDGGELLECADGTVRDMAGMHGNWRGDPDAAFARIDAALRRLKVKSARWLFDAPVSGSGTMAAKARALGWDAEVVPDPDPMLIAHDGVIATADAGILDRCGPWLDLTQAALIGGR
ncbi:MAG: hypothetical protein ACI9U2_002393 [Bradymonadia bacterium]|jgi:hypothetical protein